MLSVLRLVARSTNDKYNIIISLGLSVTVQPIDLGLKLYEMYTVPYLTVRM